MKYFDLTPCAFKHEPWYCVNETCAQLRPALRPGITYQPLQSFTASLIHTPFTL